MVLGARGSAILGVTWFLLSAMAEPHRAQAAVFTSESDGVAETSAAGERSLNDAERARAPSGPGVTRSARAPGSLFRFEYNNDLFIARDDALFSGGFGFQLHSPPLAGWDERPDGEPRLAITRWVGNHVPGLGPAGDRVKRFAWGFSHTTQTPDDLRSADFQPDDVPYAGTLGLHWSWVSFNERKLNAFGFYLGVLGPAAGAREIHALLHSGLARGPEPMGWRWQLDNEPLLNAGYSVKRKIGWPREGDRIQADLALGLHQALGNYHTATDLELEFRAGPRLPPGFVQTPDTAGQGIGLEPVLGNPAESPAAGGLRFHASFVVRATTLWYTPLLDRSAFADSVHRGVDYDPFYLSALLGLHFDYGRYSVHVNYYGSGLDSDLSIETRTSPSWINVTIDYRW